MRYFVSLLLLVVTACGVLPEKREAPENSFDPQGIEARLSGKRLVASDGTSYGLNEDGSVVGPNAKGRWSVTNGEFCRTLPDEVGEVTSWETVKFEGKEVSFLGPDGAISTFAIKRGK